MEFGNKFRRGRQWTVFRLHADANDKLTTETVHLADRRCVEVVLVDVGGNSEQLRLLWQEMMTVEQSPEETLNGDLSEVPAS